MRVTEDAAYLKHRGRPLGGGVGHRFQRQPPLLARRMPGAVEFLKQDGCAVMIGVPTYWRELKNDALEDSALHDIIRLADVVSPWTVGQQDADRRRRGGTGKLAPSPISPACAGAGGLPAGCLPRVQLAQHARGRARLHSAPPGRVPLVAVHGRQTGRGQDGLRGLMFDEVDEGTAIFKCTNEAPVAEQSKFVTYEGLPADFYLKLTGAGGKLMRGEIPLGERMPAL